eukprot:gene6121-12389_t
MSANLLLHISDTYTILLFAFVGGYIDAAGYLKLKGVFTSSITGNLVVACASVTKLEGVICRSLCSISFAFGAFLINILANKMKLTYKISPPFLAIFLVSIEAIMFIIVWIVGLYNDDKIEESNNLDAGPVVLLACLLGFAMGVQNGALREAFLNFPATTVMTTTLVNVSAMLSNTLLLYLEYYHIIILTPVEKEISLTVDPIKHSEVRLADESQTDVDSQRESDRLLQWKKCEESLWKLITLSRPLLCFLGGAVVGALLMYHIGFWCMCVPLFVTASVVMEILGKKFLQKV